MYKLIFTPSYEKRVRKFLKIHPGILYQYKKALELLEIDPNYPLLRLQQLKTKSFEGYSASIDMSNRISLKFLMTEKEIILVNIVYHHDICEKK